MKKSRFLYIPIFLSVLLPGCKNNEKVVNINSTNESSTLAEDNKTTDSSNENNKTTDSPKETVSLTVSNFSTYVAINTNAAVITNSYSDTIYFSYFIGADYCKFINCSVTYKYEVNGSSSGEKFVAHLTLSGDGQADPYIVRNHPRAAYYLVVTSAYGVVEVYR